MIGFIYNFKEDRPFHSNFVMHRAVPMAEILRPHRIELFIYSPKHLNPKTKMVQGYVVGKNGFTRKISPLPKVNGSWYTGKNRAINDRMGDQSFREFIRHHGIEVYHPYDFSHSLKDKLKTYQMLEEIDPKLHPHTELLKRETMATQLEHFLQRAPSVFLKPRKGNRGDSIGVIRPEGKGYNFSFYKNKKHYISKFDDFSTLQQRIDEIVEESKDSYLMQAGIDSISHEQCSIIVRAILLNDGEKWDWYHKVVTSKEKGDIANTSQGGNNFISEDVLPKVFSAVKSKVLLDKIYQASLQVLDYFEEKYPQQLFEVAFDFMIDENEYVHIVEINTQPGMTKPGLPKEAPFVDIFNRTQKESELYDKLVMPHAKPLAKFLLKKFSYRQQKEQALKAALSKRNG